jgi:hypothetical protein
MTVPANGALVRIVPVNGLLIDADLWGAAHDFHRHQLQRHALMLHGAGVAAGLEVYAHEPANRTLIIYPGLGIDPAGNPILLPECERYTVQTEQPGPIYIVLQFREVAAGSRGPAGPGVPTHLREAYRILEYRSLPQEPSIELARLWLTGGREPLTDAPDPLAPGPNQIDLRHRIESGGLARAEIVIGQAWLDAMTVPVSTALPLRLVQALSGTSYYHARFAGQLPPAEAVATCTLLYVAGQGPLSLSGADVEGLRAFLDAGGTIFGDSVHASADDGFSATFYDLANKLGRNLKAVFGAPPPGSAPGGLLAADGIVYAGVDYGTALVGGHPNQPLDRSLLRGVLDMTVNIAVYAYTRRRHHLFAADRRAP